MPGTKLIRRYARRWPFSPAGRPRVIFVVAHDRNRVMGRNGRLPWHLPADLKHFRSLTVGKPVVMGRRTFESIGKPLSGRRNIVLTRDASFSATGVEAAHSVGEILRKTAGHSEIAVIGGAQVFAAFAPFVDAAYVTQIDAQLDGDVHYVPPDRPSSREELGTHPADERNVYPMAFFRFDYR